MRRTRGRYVTAMFAMVMTTFSATAIAQILLAELTGKWQLTVQTEQGTGTPTLTLKQDGEKLSGHYVSQTLGEHDVSGTVKDKKFDFRFKAELQGTALDVAYTGTMETDSTLKGSIDFGGMATGTFTGKKIP